MKNKRKILTYLILSTIFCYQSCQKDDLDVQEHENTTLIQSDVFNVKSDGKMLIFNTTEDYEKIVNNPTEATKELFIEEVSKMKHTTLALHNQSVDVQDRSVFMNTFFMHIINADHIVQIGNYIYRINMTNESVYVLSAKHSNEYSDLVNENTKNHHIKVYSTDDDVIDLVENGAQTFSEKRCREDRAGKRDGGVALYAANGRNFTLIIEYEKAGVLCSLFWRLSSNYPIQPTTDVDILTENTWYKPRCRSAQDKGSPTYSGSTSGYYSKTYPIYEATRRLNGYHLKARIRYNYTIGATPYSNTSSWREIEANSPY